MKFDVYVGESGLSYEIEAGSPREAKQRVIDWFREQGRENEIAPWSINAVPKKANESMKISISELREIVAETVGRVLAEAPRKGSKRPPKDIPPRTEESELEQRDRHVRGLKGYAHSDVNDYSKPLGPVNTYKRQGASGMGGWTAEAIVRRKIKEMQIRKLVKMIVGEEVRANRGRR